MSAFREVSISRSPVPTGRPGCLRVPIGREAAVEGTVTTVRVAAFAPAFQIRNDVINSRSKEPVIVRGDNAQPAAEGRMFRKLP